MSKAMIMIVDDEPNIRLMLKGLLVDEGYDVVDAGDVGEARELLNDEGIDLILLDVKLPGTDGLGWLRELGGKCKAPIIMMSGHGTVSMAMEALRLGAQDFIEKPIQPERLLVSLRNCLCLSRLHEENADLRRALDLGGEIVGSGSRMAALREEIARTAPSEARVLITGENGTGKELVARALHAASARADMPFIKVNCAAIPSELLESELFGHERGAFTGAVARRRGKFELAQGGTILLDEIGDMNPTTQAKLLRVLEEEEMERLGGETSLRLDLRVFSSTNQDLERLMEEKGFRRDLYHRLKVVPIHVAPLRERAEDIAELCAHYLDRFTGAYARGPARLSDDGLELLRTYAWPGNVRELKNMMERLVISCDGVVVKAEDLRPLIGESAGADGPDGESSGDLATRLLAFEKRQLDQALLAAGGNAAAAARALGLDRANLHRRLQRLGLKG